MSKPKYVNQWKGKAMRDRSKDFDAAKGRSAYHFYPLAQELFPVLAERFTIRIGRTVLHLIRQDKLAYRLHVHHAGHSNLWITVTDGNGDEVGSYHVTQIDEIRKLAKRLV